MAWLQRLHAHQLIKIPTEQQLRFFAQRTGAAPELSELFCEMFALFYS